MGKVNMQIIKGKRRAGKTTEIFKLAIEDSNKIIIVENQSQKKQLLREYHEKGVTNTEILTHDELLCNREKLRSGKRPINIYIDDVDLLLYKLVEYHNINTISMDGETNDKEI